MTPEVIIVEGYVGNSRITKLYPHQRAPFMRGSLSELNASSMHLFNASLVPKDIKQSTENERWICDKFFKSSVPDKFPGWNFVAMNKTVRLPEVYDSDDIEEPITLEKELEYKTPVILECKIFDSPYGSGKGVALTRVWINKNNKLTINGGKVQMTTTPNTPSVEELQKELARKNAIINSLHTCLVEKTAKVGTLTNELVSAGSTIEDLKGRLNGIYGNKNDCMKACAEKNAVIRQLKEENNYLKNQAQSDCKEYVDGLRDVLTGILSFANAETSLEIKNVIIDEPRVKVVFADGTESIVKTKDGEKFDKSTGFVLALLKRILGKKTYFKTLSWIYEGTDPKIIDVAVERARKAAEHEEAIKVARKNAAQEAKKEVEKEQKKAAVKKTTTAKKPAAKKTAAKNTTSGAKTGNKRGTTNKK